MQTHLKLHQIVLYNFKSYFGHQVIGPFHDELNAIIGPNGSGKSNLIESLLFVFGKRARSLRANQIHHLIHNSQTHPHLGEGSVEVIFTQVEANGATSHFSLKRTVYHTSISRYEVNGQETSLEQATAQLKNRGLDIKNNRFMVLQGEVEQVFTMASKGGSRETPGLLEFLEEVIGTSIYKDEMDGLQDALTGLEDRRIEFGERVRVTRSTVEQIYPVVRASVICLSMQLYSSMFNNLVYQVRLLTLEEQSENYRSVMKEKQDKLRNCEEQLEEYQSMERRITEEMGSLVVRKKKKVGRLQEHTQKLNQLSEQNSNVRGVLEEKQKELRGMQDKESTYERELAQLRSDLQVKRSSLPQRESEVNELVERRSLAEEDAKIRSDAIHDKTTELMRKKRELENSVYPHERRRLDSENELEMLKTQRNSLMREDKDQELVDVTKRMYQMQEQEQEIQLVVDKFQQIFLTIDANKSQYTSKLKSTQISADVLSNEIQDLSNAIAASQLTNQEQSSKHQLLRDMQRASEKGLLPHICGRLGDLATINERYDTAITVACPSLDSVVVKTAADAVKCIEYLRSNKLGRCTFIPMDKLPSEVDQYINRQFLPPAGSQRLFDHLQFKEQVYRPVFYNVLRDTLVAQTVEDASYIAFKTGTRRRVVSLDGKLIELSGVMSGGGKPRRGGMAASFKNEISNDELQDYTSQRNAKNAQLDHLLTQEKQLQAVLGELQRDEHESKSRYKQNRVDLELLREQIKESSEHQLHLREQIKKTNDRKQVALTLQGQIDTLVAKIDQLRSKSEVDHQLIKQLDQAIQKVGGVEYEQLKDHIKHLTTLHDQKEAELQRTRAQMTSLTQKIDKTSELLITVEAECVVLEAKTLSLQHRLRDIEDQSLRMLEKEKRTKHKIADLGVEVQRKDTELRQYRLTYKDLQDQSDALQAEIIQHEQLLKVIVQQQSAQQSELNEAEEEYSELIAQYTHKTGNYLQVPMEDQHEDDDLSFQALFSKHYLHYKQKYVQSVRQHFIANCLNLLPERVMSKLRTYTTDEIQKLIPHQATLLEISKEHAPQEKFQCDPNILIEYIVRSEEFKDKMKALQDAQLHYQKAKAQYDGVRMQRKHQFENGFRQIACKLREIYQHLSGGGDADLDLIDSLDPFSEGVTYQVRPKSKTWKPLSKLSGGEKTLSSLSLLLAMHFHKPNSFYFFDEIDAALDYKNVGVVAQYIKSHTKNTQFCIISLRNNMFEEAAKLIGIYKLDDCTQVLPLDPIALMAELAY